MRITRVLAPNPSPFTGPGTNTWVLDSAGEAVVIDPGPVDASHERAIVTAVGAHRVRAVLVTHTHPDHAPLANPLAKTWAVPALGYQPGPDFEPDLRLGEGDLVECGQTRLEVIHTPGHSDDHLCFLVPSLQILGGETTESLHRRESVLFSGDHIMGGSSVMIEDLVAYQRSLEKLRPLPIGRLYPGHGPELDRPGEVIDWYIAHRLQREQEILAALAEGASGIDELVEVVYRDVDPALHALAARSVAAHLRKLATEGRVTLDGDRAELM